MTAPSRRLARALCAFALTVTTAVAGALAAAAAPATTGEPLLCTGLIQSQQVYSDVRVPDGATCSIYLVGIHGDLLVDRGGSVRVTRSSVVGDLISSETASLTASTVHGRVWLDDAGYLALTEATVVGSVMGRSNGIDFYQADVGQSLNVTVLGAAILREVSVGGWLNLPSKPGTRIDLSEITAHRGLTVKDAGTLSLCSVDVAEHLIIRDVRRAAAGYPNSDGGSCQGRQPSWGPDSYVVDVGGSALLEGNGTFQLRRLDVAEYLACVDNGEIVLDAGSGPDEPLVTAGLGRRGQC
ncbi:hypothetical protein J4G33_13820 [Actinotalea sp. BY-33]|uniref:Uncharacterized protein n=1 Tax=Actinotalea soli TaxID=2819234 RepID=A0A939LQY3_9CELL|nr:hypothetical protein [Actinotalea soli]MBO1752886.1 hypothetical protein [Actinotalea soli]